MRIYSFICFKNAKSIDSCRLITVVRMRWWMGIGERTDIFNECYIFLLFFVCVLLAALFALWVGYDDIWHLNGEIFLLFMCAVCVFDWDTSAKSLLWADWFTITTTTRNIVGFCDIYDRILWHMCRPKFESGAADIAMDVQRNDDDHHQVKYWVINFYLDRLVSRNATQL